MTAAQSPILDANGEPFASTARTTGQEYETMPVWMNTRNFEAGETNRLNEAHWSLDTDQPINAWLDARLAKVRSRATYEARNNGTITGIVNTLAEDVVGPDGPTLEVQSDNDAYNTALEDVWREWFKAPTTRPNVSGTAWLKLCVRNLPRAGEYLARMTIDDNAGEPVKMRLWPVHPRRLKSPTMGAANPRLVQGIEFDPFDRPVRYWIESTTPDGYTTQIDPWSPDDIIHEFVLDEETQARGFPWLTPTLQPAADLRDYDNSVQHAGRQMADQSALLYTSETDQVWQAPEETTIEPGSIRMAPPGWKPFQYMATQPPVQYPDYRAERQREIGRPLSMPLMMVRLDSSTHNYSSARFDSQGWGRFVAGVQNWISGTEQSYGTLNRLVDEVVKEVQFLPEFRNRPPKVKYNWTWPGRPHVDPLKERNADKIGHEDGSLTLTDSLAAPGKTLDSHIATKVREKKAFEDAGLPLPAWMRGEEIKGETPDPEKDDATEDAKAASNA